MRKSDVLSLISYAVELIINKRNILDYDAGQEYVFFACCAYADIGCKKLIPIPLSAFLLKSVYACLII